MSTAAEPHGVRYPWRKWLSKKKVVLKWGTDFFCQPVSLAQIATRTARRMGLKKTVRVFVNQVTIEPADPQFDHLRGSKRKRGV